jgi:hypothetical protein
MNKQKQVIQYLIENGESKKQDIYKAMQFGYYHNWEKHFGELLSRMVKNGMVERVSIGVYRVNSIYKEVLNQQKLF